VLWKDLSQAQMYVTGGVGARSERGVCTTLSCRMRRRMERAARRSQHDVNWRMLAATGEARFADVMERALYNGINSGFAGREDDMLSESAGVRSGEREKIRNPWYDTTCCPPNRSGRSRVSGIFIRPRRTGCTCTCTTTRR